MSQSINRVLIIRFSAMGDVILATPVIGYIKKIYPQATIDFITKADFSSLIVNHPYINKVYSIQSKSDDELSSIIRELKENKYDLIVDLHANLRSFIIKMMLFKSRSVTYNKDILKRRLLTNFKINFLKNHVHVVERYLKAVNRNYKNFFMPYPEIYSSPIIKQQIISWFLKLNINPEDILVGFNPGSIHATKCWPIEKYIELGHRLLEQFNVKIFLFGGAKEKLQAMEVAHKLGDRAIVASGKINLLETFELLKHMHFLVTGDTGLMHLACASFTPVISIFGPTVKEFGFWPYGKSDIMLEKNLSCRPCSLHGDPVCPKETHECMNSIQVDEVFSSCIKLLSVSGV